MDNFICLGVMAIALVVCLAAFGGLVWLINYVISVTGSECLNPDCGARRKLREVKRVVKHRAKMYGLITRRGHSSGTAYLPGSGAVPSHSTQTWQERVPIIRTVYSVTYRCSECGEDEVREEVVDEEDFSRP